MMNPETKDAHSIFPLDEKYDNDKIQYGGLRTPDISSGDTDTFSQVRFSRPFLMNLFKDFIVNVSVIPREKYEIDLFEVTRIFHNKLHGKAIDIKCVERIHHIQRLTTGEFQLEYRYQDLLKQKIENLIKTHPLVTIQYDVFIKMLAIWNALLVQWGIGSFKNYDYRYSGRALNVKMLDLNAMNQGFITIDVLWMSSKIFSLPLSQIATSSLIEMAIILHDQLKKCFEVFLMLNPKQIDPNYDIEKAIAFGSKNFRSFSNEILPEENLSNFRHAELKVVKGFAKCFKASDPKLDYAYKTLNDLELAYRTFEKLLIACILKATGKADF